MSNHFDSPPDPMMSDEESSVESGGGRIGKNGRGRDESAIVPRLQSGPPQTTTAEMVEGVTRWIDCAQSFIYVELASLVLMFACVADWYPTVWHKYALSVACVSLILCLILQTTEFLVPGFLDREIIRERDDGRGGHSVQKMCSVFLLLWWIFGTGIITFKAPFVITSNGWFAAWGGLLATVKWSIGLKWLSYNDQPEGLKQLYYIAVCSLVLVFASIPPLTQKWENYAGAGFAIAAAAITLIGSAYIFTMYSDISRNVMKVTTVLLFILWACVAGVCTFHGPFLITNNGFFACWIGCLCSLNFAVIVMKDGSPESFDS